MNLDAIEAGGNGVRGRLAEIVHDPRKLVELQRTRLRHVNEGVVYERLGRGLDH